MRYLPILRYLLILSVIACASCGTALPTVKPFKLEVQQGNVVTSKMLLQLRPGMTKSQVRFIMGTPLIQDSFHGNRWDYVYQLRENGKITEQRRVILDFETELLKTVRGDVIPTGSDKLETTQDAAPANNGARIVKPTVKAQDKSLIDKLKFWQKDATPAKDKAKESADKAKDLNINPNLSKDAPAPLATPIESPTEAAPAPETKSILVVPLESAVETTPANPTKATVPATPAKVESPRAVSTPADIESPDQNISSEKKPANPSSKGMQFDKVMLTPPEEASPAPKPAIVEPRAGNKTIPKPKDLPPEGSPGFFDRMLEKIGF